MNFKNRNLQTKTALTFGFGLRDALQKGLLAMGYDPQLPGGGTTPGFLKWLEERNGIESPQCRIGGLFQTILLVDQNNSIHAIGTISPDDTGIMKKEFNLKGQGGLWEGLHFGHDPKMAILLIRAMQQHCQKHTNLHGFGSKQNSFLIRTKNPMLANALLEMGFESAVRTTLTNVHEDDGKVFSKTYSPLRMEDFGNGVCLVTTNNLEFDVQAN